MYEFVFLVVNNGLGFEGLGDNIMFWNIIIGIVMFFGRYVFIIVLLVILSLLVFKKVVNESIGIFRMDNFIFIIVLVFVVLIVGVLIFFLVLVFGFILEYLVLWY